MVFKISDYNGGYRIVKVARSKEVCIDLLQNQYEVAHIQNEKVVFWPLKYEVSITGHELQKMDILTDGDIIEINHRGVGHRLFTSKEGDTAIVTTARCNSNCIMCPASERERKSAGDVPLHNIERLIKYLPDDLFNLVVTGGEPTLTRDNFLAVMENIRNKFQFTKVLLLTNGRSLSDKSFFEKFKVVTPRNIRIAIPVHGHKAELHDRITQVHGSFEQTLRGIRNLLDANIEVEIRIVVNKLNCDYLQDISDFIAKNLKGIFCVNFVGLEVRGNCIKNANQVLIDYSEAAKIILPAIDFLVKKGIDVGLYNYPLCLVDKRYWSIAAKSIARYKAKYYDKCELCDVKESCCGIFQASMAFIKPEVYPIQTQYRGYYD